MKIVKRAIALVFGGSILAAAPILSPVALWGLGAAVPAVTAEFIYRKWPADWPWYWGLPAWIPIQLSIGYCIFRLVSDKAAGSLLDAFVIWAFATTFMRVFISIVLLGDQIKGGTWFALGLLIMAKIAQTFWGR